MPPPSEAEAETQPETWMHLSLVMGYVFLCATVQGSHKITLSCQLVDDLRKATEEELAESLKTPRAGTRKGKKVSSANAPPTPRPVATPARSTKPDNQGESGNPAQQKRLRGKTPDPEKAQKIESLRQVGTSMGRYGSVYWACGHLVYIA